MTGDVRTMVPMGGAQPSPAGLRRTFDKIILAAADEDADAFDDPNKLKYLPRTGASVSVYYSTKDWVLNTLSADIASPSQHVRKVPMSDIGVTLPIAALRTRRRRKLTTIIAMDVVGYSHLMEIDEQGTLDRLKDARSNIIDPAIALRVIRIFVPLPQHEHTLIARSVRIRADQITVRSAPKIA